MSYTKQTWQNGDIITAEKLNHIEDGITASSNGFGVLIVTVSLKDNVRSLDKTWREIADALEQGWYIGVKESEYDEEFPICRQQIVAARKYSQEECYVTLVITDHTNNDVYNEFLARGENKIPTYFIGG